MNVWKKVKLVEAVDINMGQSPPSTAYNERGEGLPFYQGNADFGELYPQARVYCSEPTKIANENELLISVRAPVGAVNLSDQKCCVGRGLAALKPKSGCALKYLYYTMRSFRRELENRSVGTTFKSINKTTLTDLAIPLPPLAEQERIAAELDAVVATLKKRQAQLAELDALVQARFVELFGDPATNPRKHRICKLNDLTTRISDGVHAKPNYTPTGKPFISVVNITKKFVDFSDCKYVSEEDYRKMTKSIRPEKGDVLYTKVGTYGIPAYIDADREFAIYVSVCLIKPRRDVINSRFLAYSLEQPYIKRQADRKIKGIGVPDLHLNQIRDFDVMLPPRDEQDVFVDFFSQVEQIKASVRAGITETQTLFDALSARYFG